MAVVAAVLVDTLVMAAVAAAAAMQPTPPLAAPQPARPGLVLALVVWRSHQGLGLGLTTVLVAAVLPCWALRGLC
jgi:hypothetical protein